MNLPWKASDVFERVLKTTSRYSMLPPGCRVVAAVSGGADSVCLLHVLQAIGANLAGVAHFNHKLRGEESDQDERFVAAMATRLALPFYRAESAANARPGNLEQAARRARREFFLHLIRDGACDRVALAHTRDDQAETVLFRVLRGSGLAGLAGIHPVTDDGFVRPFLDLGRDEVREYLQSHEIAWREDSSNTDARFARNRIRHDVLPRLRRDWNPQIDQALAQLADLAYEEERWWQDGTVHGSPVAAARGSVLEQEGAVELPTDALQSLPRALARRLVRHSIRQAKGHLRGIEFQHIEQVLEMRPGRLRLPGVNVTRSFDWVRLAVSNPPALDPVEVIVPGTYEAAGIRLETGETAATACANLKMELAAGIVLRGWRPGDHYRPVGKSRDRKLREMFQNARIPLWRRSSWPILESEGKIVWARRFGVAAEYNSDGVPGPVLHIWDLTEES
jgi:tRNA(Ile)-lysidine synthase